MYYLAYSDSSFSGLFDIGYSLYKDGFPFIDHTHKYRIMIKEEKFSNLANRIRNVPKDIIDREVCFSSILSWVSKPNSCIFETENIEDIINLEQTHPEIFY